MITVIVINYVVISLAIANHKYWNVQYDYLLERNINKCYMNGKKSLIYGFLALPMVVLSVGCLFAIVYYGLGGLFWAIAWAFRNLP